MASVTIQKWTTAAACGGQISHMYRTREHYGNRDIDPEKAGDNVMAGTPEQVRGRLRYLIEQVDAVTPPKRVRADRKTTAELCIPAPRAGMSMGDAQRFLMAAYKALAEMPDMRVAGAAIHGDEVHEYVNPDTGERVQSRVHMHVLVVPDVPGKGCNMKSWLTRGRYGEINRVLDRVCEQVLGYPYRDGTGSRSRGDVERVKLASQRAEAAELTEKIDIMRQELTTLDKSRQKAQQDAQKAMARAVSAGKAAQTAEQAQKRSEAAQKASEGKLAEAKRRLERVEKREADLRLEVEGLDIQRAGSCTPDSEVFRDARKAGKSTPLGVLVPSAVWEKTLDAAEAAWGRAGAAKRLAREKQDTERALDAAESRVGVVSAHLNRYRSMERAFPEAFREMGERLGWETVSQPRAEHERETDLERD